MPHVCFLCTGNAARSVMAGAFFSALAPGWRVTTAGTHVVEGQPMSWRTRQALADLGYRVPGHRSHQFATGDAGADVIVGFEPAHVRYVRQHHPDGAAQTATIVRLVRDLPADTRPLGQRLALLNLAAVDLGGWEEVPDPAGGELAEVEACARSVLALTTKLANAVGSG